jgi:hypothetical protein
MVDSIPLLRQQLDRRLVAMRADRMGYWHEWRDLSAFIMPDRGRFLATPNEIRRGIGKNTKIIDSTGTKAAGVLASGMMAGITSPARPWFKLTLRDPVLAQQPRVKAWLGEVQRRMFLVFAKSNFYNALATVYQELSVFGSAVMLIFEDQQDVIRCIPLTVGQYYLGVDSRFAVSTVYREFVMAIGQVVEQFGLERCSESVRSLYRNGNVDSEILVGHAIEPNDRRIVGAPGVKGQPFRSVYWELGSATDLVLRVEGCWEFPGCAPRWDVIGNDAYGRGPGFNALPDIKQLQHEQLKKGVAIDKMVDPPMLASASLQNQPATLLPGGITYVTDGANSIGFKPVYQFTPPIGELKEDIMDVRQRVRDVFFTDLFLMISQLDTVRTATEIDERKEEKLLQLGPVLERFHAEGLSPAIDRAFAIMHRFRLIPEPPQEIADQQIDIEYISMLAQAQKAVATAGVEKLVGFIGNLAGAKPEVLDVLDADETVVEYADMLGVSSKILLSPDKVAAIRDARAKQQQQQAAMQQSLAAVQGAQVLSKTEVGGGRNALQQMIGGGP